MKLSMETIKLKFSMLGRVFVFISIFVFVSAQSVSSQTLLLRYSFDEAGAGSVEAVDSGAAPPAPGAFVGGATRLATTPANHSKGAVDFSGAAAPNNLKYVTGGDAAKLDGLEAFTLSAWINVQDVPAGNRRIMAKQAATATFGGFSWNVNDPADGARAADNFGLRLFVGGEKGFQHDLLEPRVSIDADKKWVFVAVSYDGRLDLENVKYYVGAVSAEVTNQVTTTIDAGKTLDSDARFTVSHTDAAIAANTALQGWIDDVRVYSGVLNATQLNAVRLENLPSLSAPKAVLLQNPNRSGTTMTFDFQSEAGRSHRVEFKNALPETVWQTLSTLSGSGSSLTVTDVNAASLSRVYRVATQ
jgi:hypothetical protein